MVANDVVSLASPRERQVLKLAAEGLTDKEMAVRLGVSITTVRTYWERIRQKTGAVNRSQAVAFFMSGTTGGVADAPDAEPEASTLLDAAMDATFGGIAVLAEDNTIVAVNDKLCALLNAPRASLEGTCIGAWVYRRYEGFHHALAAARQVDGAGIYTVSLFIHRQTMPDLLALVTIRTMEAADQTYLVLFVEDQIAAVDARRRGLSSPALVGTVEDVLSME